MPHYQLADIVTDIRAAQGECDVAVVAVDGPSGGGKTRLAKRIGRALGEHALIRVDGLIPGWDGLLDAPGLLAPLLTELTAGRPATYRAWDWYADRYGAEVTVPAVPNVVVEGCGSGSLALAAMLTFVIWVDVPAATRKERALRRDGPEIHQHWDRWAGQEAVLFAANRTAQRADLVIDGRRPMR